jgi:hypothetical protein
MAEILAQQQYGEMIVNIGEGKHDSTESGYQLMSHEDGEQIYALTKITTFIEDEDKKAALDYLFPTGFTP